jgi:hypothetical protein
LPPTFRDNSSVLSSSIKQSKKNTGNTYAVIQGAVPAVFALTERDGGEGKKEAELPRVV